MPLPTDALARAGRQAARAGLPLHAAASRALATFTESFIAEEAALDEADALARSALPVRAWQRQAGVDGQDTWVLPTLWLDPSGEAMLDALAAAHAGDAPAGRWRATRDPSCVLLDIASGSRRLGCLRVDARAQQDLLVWIAHTATIALIARGDAPPIEAHGAVVVRLAGIDGTLLATDASTLRDVIDR